MIIGSNIGNETIKLFMFISSQHILSQGLADHDIATTRQMLITHVHHCSLVIIQMVKFELILDTYIRIGTLHFNTPSADV